MHGVSAKTIREKPPKPPRSQVSHSLTGSILGFRVYRLQWSEDIRTLLVDPHVTDQAVVRPGSKEHKKRRRNGLMGGCMGSPCDARIGSSQTPIGSGNLDRVDVQAPPPSLSRQFRGAMKNRRG